MVRSSAIAMLFAAMTLCVFAEGAAAKNARARQAAVHRLVPAAGQAVKKPPVAPTPRQDEKSWMDRASATSSSGGGGNGM